MNETIRKSFRNVWCTKSFSNLHACSFFWLCKLVCIKFTRFSSFGKFGVTFLKKQCIRTTLRAAFILCLDVDDYWFYNKRKQDSVPLTFQSTPTMPPFHLCSFCLEVGGGGLVEVYLSTWPYQ